MRPAAIGRSLLLLAQAASTAWAQSAPEPADKHTGTTLPVVRAQAARPDEQALPVERALTLLDSERIERQQSENIFDLLKDVPGVGVVGGPRASGMRFTLRGFTDNEDVLFKIDGAVKGFEKYRFGGGVFLEPELLKTLSVERGPSTSSGSGALGGTISATTKSAADLLRAGQRVGALAKLGYNENNRERLRMLSVYGRPSERIDLMTAIVRRDSHDIRLPNRQHLPLSATHSESRLVKLGFMPLDNLLLELGRTEYRSGPERTPYDATGGLAGVGGVVRREIDDATTHLRLQWEASEQVQVRGLLAREKTRLHDRHVSGESKICVNLFEASNPSAIPLCDDYWQYDIWTAELFADLKMRLGPLDGKLSLGTQAVRNGRRVQRISANERLNTLLWPGGFNGDQPPGDKQSEALIADSQWSWGAWTLAPGLRWDRYRVIAQGGTRENMLREGQDTEISFSKAQPSIALTWRLPRSDLALTARYNQAFRPPLIDQYFRDGSGNSAGQSGLCLRSYGDPKLPGRVVTIGTIQPLYDPAGLGKPYDPALDRAPPSGICGDLYRPQESVNKELTLTWSPPPSTGSQWYARLTIYRIHTTRLLGSLRWVQGGVGQPGVEDRHGSELEVRYASQRWFGDFNLSRVRRSARNESVIGQGGVESYSTPPDSQSLSAGLRALEGRIEAGWRWRRLADRQAYIAGAPAVCAGPADAHGVGTHYGTDLLDLFASWQISGAALLRAGIDNLGNKDYCLSSSFAGGVGFHASGRAAKLALSFQY